MSNLLGVGFCFLVTDKREGGCMGDSCNANYEDIANNQPSPLPPHTHAKKKPKKKTKQTRTHTKKEQNKKRTLEYQPVFLLL